MTLRVNEQGHTRRTALRSTATSWRKTSGSAVLATSLGDSRDSSADERLQVNNAALQMLRCSHGKADEHPL
jgi:hypothetical protein